MDFLSSFPNYVVRFLNLHTDDVSYIRWNQLC